MQVISGRFRAKADRREELVELATSLYTPSRAESGALSYACFAEPTEPLSFMFFEEWTDEAALESHFATPHFAEFMERFPALIDGTPDIRIYTADVVDEAAPAGTPDLMLIAGTFHTKPERRSEVVALATGMFAPSRAEAGCLSYDFFEEIESGRGLFFEQWRDQAAIDVHFGTAHFAAFMKAFPALIDGEAQIDRYAVSAMRRL